LDLYTILCSAPHESSRTLLHWGRRAHCTLTRFHEELLSHGGRNATRKGFKRVEVVSEESERTRWRVASTRALRNLRALAKQSKYHVPKSILFGAPQKRNVSKAEAIGVSHPTRDPEDGHRCFSVLLACSNFACADLAPLKRHYAHNFSSRGTV
jgi:hypothetical protein